MTNRNEQEEKNNQKRKTSDEDIDILEVLSFAADSLCGSDVGTRNSEMFQNVSNLFGVVAAKAPPSKEDSSKEETIPVVVAAETSAAGSLVESPKRKHGEENTPASPKKPGKTKASMPTTPKGRLSPQKQKSPLRKSAKEKGKKKEKKADTISPKVSKVTVTTAPASSTEGDQIQEDEEDIDTMLANLEIPDFDLPLDNPSHAGADDDDDEKESSTTTEIFDSVDWQKRMRRDEVYSKRYRPSSGEAKELETVALALGLSSSSDFLAVMAKSMGLASKITENLHELFYGKHSILLSVVRVEWEGNDCELLLLTDGFVLKYAAYNSFNPMGKRYETCHLWTEVDYCERLNPVSIAIQVKDAGNSGRYELEATEKKGGESLGTIFKQLERVITQHALICGPSSGTETLGWQHQRIHSPGFTAAVTGNIKLLGKPSESQINEPDVYNHFTPLHYAVQQDECDIDVIKALLRAGADPNLPDDDGRSAMYYGKNNVLWNNVLCDKSSIP